MLRSGHSRGPGDIRESGVRTEKERREQKERERGEKKEGWHSKGSNDERFALRGCFGLTLLEIRENNIARDTTIPNVKQITIKKRPVHFLNSNCNCLTIL